MHDDLVAHLDVRDIGTDGPDDAARVGAADVKSFLFALLLPRLDDVDGHAQRGPDVVVVHARRHHVNEHVPRPDLGHLDLFLLESVGGLAETFGTDQLSDHALGHVAELRNFA